MPVRMPASLRPSSRSWPARAMRPTANSGVVALITEARPLAIMVWPVEISVKGMALLMTDITAMLPQLRRSSEGRPRMTRWRGTSTAAAITTRPITRTRGEISLMAMPMNRKEPPHSSDRTMSSSQMRKSSVDDCGAIMFLGVHAVWQGPGRFTTRKPTKAGPRPPGACRDRSSRPWTIRRSCPGRSDWRRG